jgi:hypothetical protein
MPSPVGHFLGGVAVGWLVCRSPPLPRSADGSWDGGWKPFRNTLLFGCAAIAPDLDLLFHSHRTATHSLAAVLLVFGATLVVGRLRSPAFAAALAGAVASHLLLDWFSDDPNSPTGIMLLWPVSRKFFSPPAAVFLSIWKDLSRHGAVTHNATAVIREILILLPVVVLIGWLRGRARAAPE